MSVKFSRIHLHVSVAIMFGVISPADMYMHPAFSNVNVLAVKGYKVPVSLVFTLPTCVHCAAGTNAQQGKQVYKCVCVQYMQHDIVFDLHNLDAIQPQVRVRVA